ncbi:hypothetical protein A6U86_04610 [Rhizobium sp. AC27/96]|nr:hypothetical protein A6U86_04610 [Rhizobium sp. AC27/96]
MVRMVFSQIPRRFSTLITGGKVQLAEQAIAKLEAFQEANKQAEADEGLERRNELRTDSCKLSVRFANDHIQLVGDNIDVVEVY